MMTKPAPIALPTGFSSWQRNGFCNDRVHYSADPEKDAAWVAALRPNYPSRIWAREMEIDFTLPAGKPVYDDTEKVVVSPQSFDPSLKIIRSWDYGYTMPYCLFAQIETLVDPETGKPGKRICHFLTETWAENILTSDFAQRHVLPKSELFPGATYQDFGDVAGRQHSDKTKQTNEEILRSLGVMVNSRFCEIEKGIELVQSLISDGCIQMDTGCKLLYRTVMGGYTRDADGKPIKDGYFDHPADALRYFVQNSFNLEASTPATDNVYRPGLLTPERAPAPRQSARPNDQTPTVYRPGNPWRRKGLSRNY